MDLKNTLVGQYLISNINLAKNAVENYLNVYFGKDAVSEFDIYLFDPYVADINQQQILRIPVLPEEITIQTDRKYETIDFANLGEVDFTSGERVQQISFASFFPATYDASYCQYPDLPDPQTARQILESLTRDRVQPVRLIITGADINMLVNVATSISRYKGGEPGDIYYELTCRSWREVKITTESTASIKQSLRARSDFIQNAKTYTVKPNDTLWHIAKRELGSSSRWQEIYNLNPGVIGPDPNLILPGQRLVMPG